MDCCLLGTIHFPLRLSGSVERQCRKQTPPPTAALADISNWQLSQPHVCPCLDIVIVCCGRLESSLPVETQLARWHTYNVNLKTHCMLLALHEINHINRQQNIFKLGMQFGCMEIL